MEKIELQAVEETLYKEVLPNGLTVYILPKKGYSKTYATYTTKYGSIDRTFTPLHAEEPIVVPDGIAHFLEHKMFEKEEGDIFHTFSQQGASVNAYTSFTRTAYLFSATSNVEKNMTTLLDFVQAPYFTEETVEKEKGIIAQEIMMYDDSPDWRIYFGAVENMYREHPVRIDIAGTVESIQDITKDHLYTCYETFYHPSNMLLFVVGAVDVEETMQLIRDNQGARELTNEPNVERFIEEEDLNVQVKERTIAMDVFKPKVNIGFKLPAGQLKGQDFLKRELVYQLGLDLLFGTTTPFYEKAYDEGFIDESFGYDVTLESTFAFATISTDTFEADTFREAVQETFARREELLTEEALERLIKRKIGLFIRSLNSPEFIANQFTNYAFHDTMLFDHVDVYRSITLEDVKEALQWFVQPNNSTVMQIVPMEKEEA